MTRRESSATSSRAPGTPPRRSAPRARRRQPCYQYKRLLGLALLDTDAQRLVYAARLIGHGVLVRAGEDDFEHLIESVAAEANHEADHRRRRSLDDVLAVLEGALG